MTGRIRRRRFLQAAAGLLLAPGKLLGAVVRSLVPNRKEAEAIAAGRQLGVGSVRLEGPDSVEVLSHPTWTLIYTAGRAGVQRGGGVRIAMRHLQSMPQTTNPQGPGYLTAKADGDVPLRISIPDGSKVFMNQYFPWQNIVQVMLAERGLAPGQTMRVTLGDRSSGGPGIPVQPYDEAHYAWKCYVDCQGNGNYLPLADRPSVRVVAAEPYRLRVLMPSGTVAGQPTSCLVRAEDRYGNPALRYRGTVTLRSTDPQARLPAAYTFTEADRGVHRFEAVVFQWLGNHTLGAADGRFQAVSNPVRVTRTRPDRLLLWGDLHGHTLFSDGRGTVEEYYDFAQRVAGLDFCAVTDHAFELLDEMWEHSKAVTNRYNQPGRFVTFQGYEWSGPTEVGGDHNVYFLDDDPPLYRSALMYDPRNLQMDHGPQPKVEHVEELLAKLAWRLGNKDVFCIPHFGGRRGNPKWHNEKVQRLIEIFSEHRRSEDWANTFLTRGHRLGIMASGDDHYGNPGYGYFRPSFRRPKKEIGMGCLAVYAAEHTRQSIFHALYDRHVYATSGDRIILDVHADGHPMGSEYRTTSPPVIHVEAAGTVRVARVEIKKNGKAVFTHQPGQIAVSLQWRDPDFQADRPCYYYVRILQDNNEEAISSPIWVN